MSRAVTIKRVTGRQNYTSLCSVLASICDVSIVDVEAASAIIFPHEKPLNANRITAGPM